MRAFSRRFCPQDNLLAGIVALGMSVRVVPAQNPLSDGSIQESSRIHLASLQRAIREFDFEEAEQRFVEFPDNFYRRSTQDGASAEGFPPFGTMKLANDTADSGSWSFKFELDGGSMAARTFNGVLPILPYADYGVTTRVRTSGLNHARARLVAWFNDAHGTYIPGSRVESELIQTAGSWEEYSIELMGEFESATDIIVELQALQPGQYLNADELADQLVFEDVSGAVWYDAVRILHLPRVELQSEQSGNITRLPETPRLSVLVRDHASAPLTSHLLVFNLDGEIVFEHTYGPSRGLQRKIINLPIKTCGWYRAVLLVHTNNQLTGRRWLDFAVVSEQTRPITAGQNRFGIVLPEQTLPHLDAAPDLIRHLRVGGVVMPIWTRAMTGEGRAERYDRLRQVISQFLETDIEVTFSLNQLPDELSQALGLDSNQILSMFNEDPAIWRSHLELLLVNFGLEVRRWQIGETGTYEYTADRNIGLQIKTAEKSLSRFVADPQLLIPWPADYALPSQHPLESIHVGIPYHISPESIRDYSDLWNARASSVSATFEPLDETAYSPRQRITDLMLRTLYGWGSPIDELNILAPWSWSPLHDDQLAIDPIYPVWRTLADRLNGRTFGGEINTIDGVHCWILKGEADNDSALAVWSDRLQPLGEQDIKLFLGTEHVQVIDAFGNVQDIDIEDGMHTISPTEMPVFIENINLELAQFRSTFLLESDFIPAVNRVHHHSIVLRNPWNSPISGELNLIDTEDLEISPRGMMFTLRPGATTRLPVEIVVGRNVLAGPKTITAEVLISADREYRMQMQTKAEVGLPNIEFTASWTQAYNVNTNTTNLIVTQVVTNTGDTVLNLDVFVMAPDVSVRRRRLPPLGPGESITRRFNLGSARSVISARMIRVGVEERNGNVRFNRLLAIPKADESAPQVGLVPN